MQACTLSPQVANHSQKTTTPHKVGTEKIKAHTFWTLWTYSFMFALHLKLARICTFVAVVQLVGAWNTFTVPHSPGQDDTPAILAALPSFVTNSTILFQEGLTYNIFTPIKFPIFSNVEIRIEGNLTYPTDIPTIQGRPPRAKSSWVHTDVYLNFSQSPYLSEFPIASHTVSTFLKTVSSLIQVPGNILAVFVEGTFTLIVDTQVQI